jgi:hypothetical protein
LFLNDIADSTDFMVKMRRKGQARLRLCRRRRLGAPWACSALPAIGAGQKGAKARQERPRLMSDTSWASEIFPYKTRNEELA